MKLTALDLELNQPSGKIIQIGAVIGDTKTGDISQRLKIYVNPGEPIAPFITDLCGITQDQIDSDGVDLDTAYSQLKSWHRQHSEFMNVITWGGGDSDTIYRQLSDASKDDWCFGRRWIDAKTIHVSSMIAKQDKVYSGGLSTAMKAYNLKFQGRKHDALDDAENTFKIYYEMIYRLRHGSL